MNNGIAFSSDPHPPPFGVMGGNATNDFCPCPTEESTMEEMFGRKLAEVHDPEVWETVLVSVTVAIMFGFMITDKIGPDWVMLTGLIVFMVTDIVSIEEGLKGFSNEGILTVLALFVVAEAVSRTGALDYYMGKILGTPKTIAGAQIRLMVPIATLSAFFNNTPIVAVMVPLTLRWAKMIGFPRQQLLIPLSYATILGGTCTLVGTSTNLVVQGLLTKKYPNEPAGNIGLFDIAIYGVPNCLIGLAYMLMFSPWLLPYGRNFQGSRASAEFDDLLLGARVLSWSPAAGRTVKRSGLGNSAGIYLVNVRRAATGNVHHAVSSDFVVSVGDELYFTGSIDEFSDFCEKHGLEILTTENVSEDDVTVETVQIGYETSTELTSVADNETERLRLLNRLSDQIEGREPVEPGPRSTRVLVTSDAFHTERTVLVGVDSQDRPGLLSDISEALFQTGLQIKHSEANVVEGRSLSVWRCETKDSTLLPDHDMVLTQICNMLPDAVVAASDHSSATSRKTSGARVVRAFVTKSSRLIGQRPVDVKFSEIYKAALMAYQKNGKNSGMDTAFTEGDLLLLATKEGSPLLTKPPPGFYNEKKSDRSGSKLLKEDDSDIEQDDGTTEAWTNLKVVFEEEDTNGQAHQQSLPKGEFLTAVTIPPKSPLENKSLNALGYTKMPGAVLVSCERPVLVECSGAASTKDGAARFVAISPDDLLKVGDVLWFSGCAEAIGDLQKIQGLVFYQDKEIAKATSILQDRRLEQAVVARGSPLIGRTVTDVHFRTEYGGAVIAIQRGSERVHEHPGTVRLQTGDVLLIEAGPSFAESHAKNYKVFALVSEVENSSPPRPRLFLVCLVLIATSFVIAAVELQSLLVTASIAGIVMVSLGIVTQQEARDAIQWDLFIVVGSAFGVAAAMTNSGVAKGLATFLVNIGTSLGIGDAGVYGAVYLAANLLSSVLTNNAAALLTFPIAMEAVDQTGADRLKMSFILMLAASDYMTSFGYQTNLMVYGPGGYTNLDFMKFGSPMQVILWLSSTAMVATSTSETWFISWLVTALAFVVVAAIRLTNGAILQKKKPLNEKDVAAIGLKEDNVWQASEEVNA